MVSKDSKEKIVTALTIGGIILGLIGIVLLLLKVLGVM